VRQAQGYLDERAKGLGFTALVLPCDGLGVMEIASGLDRVLGPTA